IDEQPAEKARKQRHALPDPRAPPTGQNLLEDLHIRAIRDDQVVEALADAPLSLAWLPIHLLAREPAEHALHFVGDEKRLRQNGGEVAVLEVIVHPIFRGLSGGHRGTWRSSFVASSQLASRGRIAPPERWR